MALIQTELPGSEASVLEKTVAVVNARLAAFGNAPALDLRCRHDEAALVAAIAKARAACELILILGASAITDQRDVIPASILASGGKHRSVRDAGRSGNLLLLGEIGKKPVIGLPGCARSPKLNGFDWVLHGAGGRSSGDREGYPAYGRRRAAERDSFAPAALQQPASPISPGARSPR